VCLSCGGGDQVDDDAFTYGLLMLNGDNPDCVERVLAAISGGESFILLIFGGSRDELYVQPGVGPPVCGAFTSRGLGDFIGEVRGQPDDQVNDDAFTYDLLPLWTIPTSLCACECLVSPAECLAVPGTSCGEHRADLCGLLVEDGDNILTTCPDILDCACVFGGFLRRVFVGPGTIVQPRRRLRGNST
jgi:hypothetical protein